MNPPPGARKLPGAVGRPSSPPPRCLGPPARRIASSSPRRHLPGGGAALGSVFRPVLRPTGLMPPSATELPALWNPHGIKDIIERRGTTDYPANYPVAGGQVPPLRSPRSWPPAAARAGESPSILARTASNEFACWHGPTPRGRRIRGEPTVAGSRFGSSCRALQQTTLRRALPPRGRSANRTQVETPPAPFRSPAALCGLSAEAPRRAQVFSARKGVIPPGTSLELVVGPMPGRSRTFFLPCLWEFPVAQAPGEASGAPSLVAVSPPLGRPFPSLKARKGPVSLDDYSLAPWSHYVAKSPKRFRELTFCRFASFRPPRRGPSLHGKALEVAPLPHGLVALPPARRLYRVEG